MNTAEQRKRIAEEMYAQVKAVRPDLFERCVRLGDATRDTIDRGYDSLHVAASVEEMAVLLVGLALNLGVVVPVVE